MRTLLVYMLAFAMAGCSFFSSRPVTPDEPPPDEPPVMETTSGWDVRISPAIIAAVEARDRSAEDRALDDGRQPVRTFDFFGVAPGMKVAEIGAGGGYGAELLARIVGPEGQVIGHNAPFVLDRFAQAPWTARLTKPLMSNVIRSDRPFEDPFPPGTEDLDVVLNVLVYHDTFWQGVDRRKMNLAIFDALKPGGVYGIVDHHAAEKRGAQDAETLHRVEESLVIKEIEAAGFVLGARGNFLRNSNDLRDWNTAPSTAGERRGRSDRFVLIFVKPR